MPVLIVRPRQKAAQALAPRSGGCAVPPPLRTERQGEGTWPRHNKKPVPDTVKQCQGRVIIHPRGTTLIRGRRRTLCRILTYPRQITDALPSQNTRKNSFDCALSGPFDGLFSARLSASRALCTSISAVISASTVSSFLYTTTFFESCQGFFHPRGNLFQRSGPNQRNSEGRRHPPGAH